MVPTPAVLASRFAVMRRPTGAHIDQPQGDGGNSASLPEESTKDTVKTIRAGKAGRPAHLWSTPCAFLSPTDLRVPPAPGLPCALWSSESANDLQSSGETRRGNADARLLPHTHRHRPRRRAIQYSRDVHDRAEKPRRTGFPAYAGNDRVTWRGRLSPHTPSLRGALATKQSRVPPQRQSGLLRYARNDVERASKHHARALVPRTQRSGPADAEHRPGWCAAEPGPMPQHSAERWVPALRSSARTPQRVRDTRVTLQPSAARPGPRRRLRTACG